MTASCVEQWFEKLGLPNDYAQRFGLPLIAQATDLVSIGQDIYGREQWALEDTRQAWLAMQHAAFADGITLSLVSAYRSIDYQASLIEKKIKQGQTIEEILKVSAAPGFSQHHSGRALDLTTPESPVLDSAFAETEAYAWLLENAQRFEFEQTFGPNNRHGLIWEPWHWCHQPFLISA